jgi:hypothetical protein
MKIDINMIKILGIELAERGYYINLNSSIDRRERVESQIIDFDIQNLERFEALEDPFIQYSCTKSHLSIFEKCLADNVESVLIFEDDFQLYENCNLGEKSIHISECLANLKNDMNNIDWDVILLGCNPRTYLIPITENLALNSKSTGAWGYIIKKNAFKFLLENLNYKKDLIAIDDFLPMLNQYGFVSLTTIPLIVHHGINLVSTLQPMGLVNYDRMIEGNYQNYLYNFINEDFSIYDTYKLERELTIVITGHFVENFLFYLRYLLYSIPYEIEKCRFLIIYDTAHNSVQYEKIRKLIDYFKNRNKPINYDLRFSNGGLVDSVSIMLKLLKTKYFLFLEHDWVFLQKDRINFNKLIDVMNTYNYVNAVWFNKDDNQLRGFEICGDKNGNITPYEREIRIDEIDLTKTIRWSNNPAIFRTEKFIEWFNKYINNSTIGINHQGQYNVEDNMIREYRKEIENSVWEEIKDNWGTYLYGDIGSDPFVGHTDGSRRYQTNIRTMAEDNADHYIKNNPLPTND